MRLNLSGPDTGSMVIVYLENPSVSAVSALAPDVELVVFTGKISPEAAAALPENIANVCFDCEPSCEAIAELKNHVKHLFFSTSPIFIINSIRLSVDSVNILYKTDKAELSEFLLSFISHGSWPDIYYFDDKVLASAEIKDTCGFFNILAEIKKEYTSLTQRAALSSRLEQFYTIEMAELGVQLASVKEHLAEANKVNEYLTQEIAKRDRDYKNSFSNSPDAKPVLYSRPIPWSPVRDQDVPKLEHESVGRKDSTDSYTTTTSTSIITTDTSPSLPRTKRTKLEYC